MISYPEVVKDAMSTFVAEKRDVSVDFEYNPPFDHPDITILGLSSGGRPHSARWTAEAISKLGELEAKGVVWVGHNSLTVEKKIIEEELGLKYKIPIERMEDTMLRHFLCNAELCKGASKGTDEDDEDYKEKGLSYMGLWSMSSLYTDLPNWKACRGERCGGPCRIQDPLGYNGLDVLACDIALPALKEEMKKKGIPESIYEMRKKLTVLCDLMTQKGIKVDRVLIAKLEKEFNQKKNAIFPSHMQNRIGKKGQQLKTQDLVWDAPFNPRSPLQVKEWFQERGVYLADTDKDSIKNAMEDCADPEAAEWLGKLFDYKDAGKGLKPWTDERYFGEFDPDFLHPRFITTASSLGRLGSANPNFQNMPHYGWGAEIRAAIIPRDPSLMIVEADKKQGELRMCLWCSGVEPPKDDAFKWLVANSGGMFDEVAKRNPERGWSARSWAKSVSHGGDYLEGVKVYRAKELDSPRTKRLIELGALVVHRDWPAFGGLVGFTGVNLAERLFGSASWENRAKALQIQEAYFHRFQAIRKWHKKITAEAERGYVRSVSGRYLTLLGTPEDKIKVAAAFYGQGGLADDVQEKMCWYYDAGDIPMFQIHDSLGFEFPVETPDSRIVEFFEPFGAESKILPGFSCPIDIKKGPNWKDLKEVNA